VNRRDFDPMGSILTLREAMNRLLEESVVPSVGNLTGAAGLHLSIDVYETRDAVIVRAALPGARPDDIDITVTGDNLTLRAEVREAPPDGAEVQRRQREHRYGLFTRSLTLPAEVQSDRVEATFEHGMLTLTMPKARRLQPKTIRINTRGGATPITAAAGATGRDASAPGDGGATVEQHHADDTAPQTEYVTPHSSSADTAGGATSAPAAIDETVRGTAGAAATQSASPSTAAAAGPSDADADVSGQ